MVITNIRAYGDSFTRYTGNVSDFWPAKLSVFLDKPIENLGYSSISNFSIALHVLRDWGNQKINSKTLLLIMLSDCTRMPVINESCHGFTSDHAYLSEHYKFNQPFRRWYRTNEWIHHFRIQEHYTMQAFYMLEHVVRASRCQLRYMIGWSDIDDRFPNIQKYLTAAQKNTWLKSDSNNNILYSISSEIIGKDQSDAKTNSEFFIPNDGHWTPYMHTLVAGRIAEYARGDIR